MQFQSGRISGLVLIEPRVFADDRGCFLETYRRDRFAEAGIDLEFVQDNLSHSKQGVLRGLHYQIEHAQGKLVRALSGGIFDVAVDMRRSSPTFGQWEGYWLSAENRRSLYIPPGFAHGFYAATPTADVLYKCTDLYSPSHERTLLWNDETVQIAWPLQGEPLLSPKDKLGKRLQEAEAFA